MNKYTPRWRKLRKTRMSTFRVARELNVYVRKQPATDCVCFLSNFSDSTTRVFHPERKLYIVCEHFRSTSTPFHAPPTRHFSLCVSWRGAFSSRSNSYNLTECTAEIDYTRTYILMKISSKCLPLAWEDHTRDSILLRLCTMYDIIHRCHNLSFMETHVVTLDPCVHVISSRWVAIVFIRSMYHIPNTFTERCLVS